MLESRLKRAAALTVMALFASTPHPCHAGELLVTRSGQRVHWTREEISLMVIPTRTGASVSTDLLVRELRKAAALWNQTLERTKAPRFRVAEVDSEHGAVDRVGRNGQSIVVFQTARRCARNVTTDIGCYAEEQNAITHVYPNEDGTVDEADIAINGVDVAWEVSADGGETPRLRAVLLHELGHVLGLEHSCTPVPAARTGLPLCSSAEAKVSLMYPDTLEAGRPLVLEPGHDEVSTLRSAYGVRAGCFGCRASRGEVGSSAEWLAVATWIAIRARRRGARLHVSTSTRKRPA